jgi:hypothetical protein
MPVAPDYLLRRLLLLFSSFGAVVMYILYIYTYIHMYIYKDIVKFVPLQPCAPTPPTTMTWGSGAQFRHVMPPWQAASIINHHDYVFPRQGHCLARAWVLVMFHTPGRERTL